MGLHIPSFLVGSIFAGSGFLLIHRELSHRRRLTTQWVIQEYGEESWREWRKSSAANQIEDAKVSIYVLTYHCIHVKSVYCNVRIYTHVNFHEYTDIHQHKYTDNKTKTSIQTNLYTSNRKIL